MAEDKSSGTDWVISIKNDIKHLVQITSGSSKREHTIFRVRPQVRRRKPDHFNPDFLSFGLFHGSRFNLEDPTSKTVKGRKCSVALASAFLQTLEVNEDFWEKLCARVVGNPNLTQDLYEMEKHEFQPKEVLQCVLSLDAISLVTHLGALVLDSATTFPFPLFYDHISREGESLLEIVFDFLKLENQIPLDLLRNVLLVLYETGPGEDASARADAVLNEMCSRFTVIVSDILPGFEVKIMRDFQSAISYLECDHLLGCLSRVMRPASEDAFTATSDKKKQKSEITLPSATELLQGGIEFQGRAGGTFDLMPDFRRGWFKATLYIPRLSITGATEQVWRNLVAYEAAIDRSKRSEFMSFLKFMDELVDKEEDVLVMSEGVNPVIPRNELGTEKDVADLFNTMVQNYIVSDTSQWVDLRKKIKDYNNQNYRKMILDFYNANFGQPWLVISVAAATFLLILTVLQTIYTILPYYKP